MKKKIGRIIVGIVLVALAALIVMSALDIGIKMPADIQVWQWIVGSLILIVALHSIINLVLFSTFLMLGIEVMVFEPQLGWLFGFEEADWISNWLVLLISVLAGIGFSLIFKGSSSFVFKVKKNTLGSTVKYIDCADFKSERVENKMGELEVRFENVCALTEDAVLEVHNTLGETSVYIPADWSVQVNLVNALGEINVDEAFRSPKGNKKSGKILDVDVTSGEDNEEPTLTVKVFNKLGETKIKAV